MKKKIAVVSKCLLGIRCRYDGEKKDYGLKKKLEKNFRIIYVCPEADIGLSIPREPIKLIMKNDRIIFIQKRTGLRLKRRLENFSVNFLKGIRKVDLFVLKSRSPSCGNMDCKVFANLRDECVIDYADGIFTSVCKKYFPSVPFYNEDSVKKILN